MSAAQQSTVLKLDEDALNAAERVAVEADRPMTVLIGDMDPTTRRMLEASCATKNSMPTS